MTNITHKEYIHEVKLIAENVHKEVLEEHPEDSHERDELMYERVNEQIDSHMWVVYYSYNLRVIAHTSNQDAYQDIYSDEDLGSIVSEQGFKGLHSTIAYFAMVADVNAAIDEL